MKKRMFAFALSIIFVLAMAGCGGDTIGSGSSVEGGSVAEESIDNTPVDTEKPEQAASEDVHTKKDEATDTSVENVQKLSEDEIEVAKQVALKYYSNTVFEVNSITYVERGSDSFAEGECNFTVNVSKDGVVQEPDRMIQLDRKDDSWEVVGEGY